MLKKRQSNFYSKKCSPRNVVTLLIVYELDRCSQYVNADFTLEDCLCRAID